MTTIVEIKQLIKSFYVRYEMWITPLWKFLLSFIALTTINSQIGYMTAIKPVPIALMCALLCSFMPVNFMVFVASIFILAHFYAVSIETLAVSLVIFLLMFLLYFRFGPGDTVVLMLMPLLFMLRIPYLMPLALGLLAGPLSAAGMSCGVVIYYLLSYVRTNAATMGASSIVNGEDSEIIVQLRTFLTGFLTNRAMWITVIAFAIVLVVVWLLRRLPVNHSWKIAILGGAVVNLIVLMAGDFLYDTKISFPGVLLGTFVSALLCFVLEFFFFQLDYTRTERVQFEDDDYYYYVKAVPKVALPEPERKVKKINRTHHQTRNAPRKTTSARESAGDEDEEEILRERVPMRSAERAAASSARKMAASDMAARRTPARPTTGQTTASRTARQVSTGTRSMSASATRSSAAKGQNSLRARETTDADRVIRVGRDTD